MPIFNSVGNCLTWPKDIEVNCKNSDKLHISTVTKLQTNSYNALVYATDSWLKLCICLILLPEMVIHVKNVILRFQNKKPDTL